jgi:hypothetical protein
VPPGYPFQAVRLAITSRRLLLGASHLLFSVPYLLSTAIPAAMSAPRGVLAIPSNLLPARGVDYRDTSIENLNSCVMRCPALILITSVLAFASCSDDDAPNVTPGQLRGDWVRVDDNTDTLSFSTIFDDRELMFLKRTEPYRTGPYEYKLLPDDKISIHWMLAATLTFHDYHFKVSGNTLQIGNFYEAPAGDILTFRKVE